MRNFLKIFVSLATFAISVSLPRISFFNWNSVQRSLSFADIVYMNSCNSKCTNILRSTEGNISSGLCYCQCDKNNPAFLPSETSCVHKLDECQRSIPFEVKEVGSRWIPTLTIPATNNLFGPSNRLMWNKTDIIVHSNGTVNCYLSEMYVQGDRRWSKVDRFRHFALEIFDGTTFLKWRGGETEAQSIEGNLVQLRLICYPNVSDAYCITFRIAGVQVHRSALSLTNDRSWDRLEIIACLIFIILLIVAIAGGLSVWNVCWKIQKNKLISNLHLQFLHHLKQQQLYINEQLTIIRANAEKHYKYISENECISQPVNQRKKLYFSAEFFEPESLANPPELAQNFVTELRKMISAAKDRIKSKRHVPVLTTITENEENCENMEINEEDINKNVELNHLSSNLNSNANFKESQPSQSFVCSNFNVASTKTKDLKLGKESELLENSSPKSLKSMDSGCDSMSDEENCKDSIENSICEETVSNVGKIKSTSTIDQTLTCIVNSYAPVHASSKMILPLTPSPLLPPKPSNRARSVIQGISSTHTLSDSPPPLPPRTQLKRVLADISPPDGFHPISSLMGVEANKRKIYAVFSNDGLRKKSLPKRSRKLNSPSP